MRKVNSCCCQRRLTMRTSFVGVVGVETTVLAAPPGFRVPRKWLDHCEGSPQVSLRGVWSGIHAHREAVARGSNPRGKQGGVGLCASHRPDATKGHFQFRAKKEHCVLLTAERRPGMTVALRINIWRVGKDSSHSPGLWLDQPRAASEGLEVSNRLIAGANSVRATRRLLFLRCVHKSL